MWTINIRQFVLSYSVYRRAYFFICDQWNSLNANNIHAFFIWLQLLEDLIIKQFTRTSIPQRLKFWKKNLKKSYFFLLLNNSELFKKFIEFLLVYIYLKLIITK